MLSVVLVGIGLAVIRYAAPDAVAAPQAPVRAEDRITASWNMRGEQSTEGDIPESRWTSGVPSIFREDQAEIAALQEAGNAPPPTAVWNQDTHLHPLVDEFQWNAGNSERPDVFNIYWAHNPQNRNGLAIVSRLTAREAVQLVVHSDRPNGTPINTRPLMGVRFGDDWYFVAHAPSMGGTDN